MSSTIEQRMGAFDAVMWNVEHDPVLRSVIVAVLMLDKAPDIDTAVDRIDRMTLAVPKLRQRVIGNPVSLVPPRWEVDPNFDLDYHLRWVAAPPEDASMRRALNLAEKMAEQDFDRKRPLWEMALMTGLPEGQAVVILKIHHSITDGMGGLAMAANLLDLAREPEQQLGPKPEPPTASVFGLPKRLASGVSFEAKRVAISSRALVTGGAGLAGRALTSPADTATEAGEFAASAARLLAPASTPVSPRMTMRSLSSHFDYTECDFADFKAVSKAFGVTINDVFLAVVTRGLHRYHQRYGADVDGLRVNMPINLRTGVADAQGGNRWVPARVIVPVQGGPLQDHLEALAPVLKQARTEPALMLSDQVYRMLVRMPTPASTSLASGMMKGTDFAATNLPGPPIPVYFAGAEVLGLLPFAPRGGAALNVALMTYAGRAQLAVNIDERAVPDTENLVADIRAALDDVLAATPS